MLVDLQVHARMAERGAPGNVARSVAGEAGGGHADHFGRRGHGACDSKRQGEFKPLPLLFIQAYPHLMTEAAISIRNLAKTYAPKDGGGKRALDGVTFDVPRGQIFGLLGPNGAGKSTLINILAGLVNKSEGAATIWGFDIDAHPRNAKASIGIVNQEILFDPFFSPVETLEIQAGLYGIPKKERRSMELLRAVHLEDKANAYARTLSGGMKRRLMVAKAMVHSPPVLVLDEPTAGVDIELRQQLWTYVRSLNDAGVTVVLTTHYLEEAEELCDRIAIINNGKLIANEPTRELVGRAQEKVVAVTVDRDLTAAPDASCFEKIVLKGSRVLEITYHKDRVNAGEVLAAVTRDGLGIIDVSTREPDLEDVFLSLTRAANA
jgi:ABC-2 type transport system ATP-binding protein